MLCPFVCAGAQHFGGALRPLGSAPTTRSPQTELHAAAPEAGAVNARRAAFEFSYVSYALDERDGVFTDSRAHAAQNFGFRLNRVFRQQQHVGWMLDGELFLGVLNRELIDVPLTETNFGLQAFAGPQLRLGRITANVAAGVNRLSIPGSELVTSSRQSVIQYVGRGGLSRLCAANLNALTAKNQLTVLASIPAYAKVAPAGLLGLAFDFGKQALGF